MSRLVTAGLVLAVVALGWAADHYYGKAVDWRDKYRTAYSTTQLQADTIDDMQARQQSLAALDAKHSKELADAQNQIDALERDVADGLKRLRLNARCPSMPAGKTSGPTGVDDGAGTRLTPAAERNKNPGGNPVGRVPTEERQAINVASFLLNANNSHRSC
mgnify:CR=1 FL=1